LEELMQTQILKIEGMTCGGCVRSVAAVLKALPGVEDARVSLERNEAQVTFDPTQVDVTRLKGAVEEAGYRAV
jgi:copper chaperone